MRLDDMLSFEESPWELFARKLEYGGRISASRFLALLEGEGEGTVEEAFRTLEEASVTLEVTDLPKPVSGGELGKRLALEEKLVRQDNLFTGLTDEDPLKLYLEELAGIPVCGDVNVLALELAVQIEEGKK